MRHNLNLPQRGIIEAGLKGVPVVVALFLDYLGRFFRSPGIKHINFGEHEYAWLDLHTAACDLPCLVPSTLSKEAQVQKVSRWLACLRKLGLVETHRMNGRMYFHPTSLALEILGGRASCRISQEHLAENGRRKDSRTIYEQNNKEHALISQEDDIDFEEFWQAYPRKVSKADARRAWEQTRSVRPPLEVLLEAVWTASEEWESYETRFIPYPSTWLRKERSMDANTTEEPPEPPPEGWREWVRAKYPDVVARVIDGPWEGILPEVQAEVRAALSRPTNEQSVNQPPAE
jgi:hypothetical protein